MKGIRKFLEDDDGVENAVYSILMIAIVVIVALMIGSLVLSRGGQLQVLAGTPKASLTGVLTGGANPTLLINHESGDPLNATQLSLSVFDDNGVLIGTTSTGGVSPPVAPTMLSSGMQTSAIPLSLNPGQSIVPGSRYTIKVTNAQSKQQVSMMVLVAR
ncbi:MAG TPA: type IV pilin N-terminal domain-containing protein [Methanocella sp.]|nr:type IV pilin N-terminal domain-containing protein [Methanocella sp.]